MASKPQQNENQGTILVEDFKPLLQSSIWKLQRDYYKSLSNDKAVAKCSAFTASSNCYVARVGFLVACYQGICVRYSELCSRLVFQSPANEQ